MTCKDCRFSEKTEVDETSTEFTNALQEMAFFIAAQVGALNPYSGDIKPSQKDCIERLARRELLGDMMCHRFPKAVAVEPDHWCGEFSE